MNLREATSGDVAAIARLHRTTIQISLRFLPVLHTAEEDLAFVRDCVMTENAVWVSELDDTLVGYVAFNPEWIAQLYVHPDHQRAGIGSGLLAKATEDGRKRQLWAFQKNDPARRFYERHGAQLIRMTDGRDNEEREPDVLYEIGGV